MPFFSCNSTLPVLLPVAVASPYRVVGTAALARMPAKLRPGHPRRRGGGGSAFERHPRAGVRAGGVGRVAIRSERHAILALNGTQHFSGFLEHLFSIHVLRDQITAVSYPMPSCHRHVHRPSGSLRPSGKPEPDAGHPWRGPRLDSSQSVATMPGPCRFLGGEWCFRLP
jgi:hypothetical protein